MGGCTSSTSSVASVPTSQTSQFVSETATSTACTSVGTSTHGSSPSRGSPNGSLKLELPEQEEFQEFTVAMSLEYDQRVGLELKRDDTRQVLVIVKVTPGGCISSWRGPSDIGAVQVGDCIVRVNETYGDCMSMLVCLSKRQDLTITFRRGLRALASPRSRTGDLLHSISRFSVFSSNANVTFTSGRSSPSKRTSGRSVSQKNSSEKTPVSAEGYSSGTNSNGLTLSHVLGTPEQRRFDMDTLTETEEASHELDNMDSEIGQNTFPSLAPFGKASL